jgi:hypothetical protein
MRAARGKNGCHIEQKRFDLIKEMLNFRKEQLHPEKKLEKLLTGYDLIKIFSLKRGKQIGEILHLIEDEQIEGKLKSFGGVMKKCVFVFLVCIFFVQIGWGQTTGDLRFIGFNGDDPDALAFVTLVDIPGASTVYFTDDEWTGSAFAGSEGGLIYTTPGSGLTAGDVVTLESFNTASPTASVGSVTKFGSINLSVATDEVFMYLGSDEYTPTTFLCAITNTGDWEDNANLSGTGLTDGVDALVLASSTDAGRYTGLRTGTEEQLKGYIQDIGSNWELTTGDGTTWLPFDTTPFIITVPLPVELAYFHAGIEEGGVKLYWGTASEIDNIGFYLYKNGEKLTSLIAGAGTSNEAHDYSYFDANVTPGELYTYSISDIEDNTGTETFHPEIAVIAGQGMINPDDDIPEMFILHDNYPNPFNPSTTVSFDLPEAINLELAIYDAAGKLVKTFADGMWNAGSYSVIWNGQDDDGDGVSSGTYFCKMVTEKYSETKILVLLK